MEEWKPIGGYEGIYEVSNHGRVRRIAARCDIQPNSRLKDRKTLRILRLEHTNTRYLRVMLSKEGLHARFLVHRLVVAAFTGPIRSGLEVNHRDGDPSNNRLDNLEAVTRSENQKYSKSALGRRRNEGSKHGMSKLNESQVICMRRLGSIGVSGARLAKIFRMSPSTICYILRGNHWAHLVGK